MCIFFIVTLVVTCPSYFRQSSKLMQCFCQTNFCYFAKAISQRNHLILKLQTTPYERRWDFHFLIFHTLNRTHLFLMLKAIWFYLNLFFNGCDAYTLQKKVWLYPNMCCSVQENVLRPYSLKPRLYCQRRRNFIFILSTNTFLPYSRCITPIGIENHAFITTGVIALVIYLYILLTYVICANWK